MRISPTNIGRAIGALGSSIPGIGDIGTLAFIKKKAGTPIGRGAAQGLKYAGGPIALASWTYMGYQQRSEIQNASARSLEVLSGGLYRAPDEAWENTPRDRVLSFLNPTPGMEFGSLSTAGEDVATPGHLKIGGSAPGRSAPYARRRNTAPWCFTHKKRHWCDITRKR